MDGWAETVGTFLDVDYDSFKHYLNKQESMVARRHIGKGEQLTEIAEEGRFTYSQLKTLKKSILNKAENYKHNMGKLMNMWWWFEALEEMGFEITDGAMRVWTRLPVYIVEAIYNHEYTKNDVWQVQLAIKREHDFDR